MFKISKYNFLLNYIDENEFIKPFEVRKKLGLISSDNTLSSYINILNRSFFIERIDTGIYKKTDIFFKISLKELMNLYKKMQDNNFKLKYIRNMKLKKILK